MKFISLLTFLSLLVVTSCSSMNLEKCQSANWEGLGLTDATYRHANNFDSYSTQCQEYGITANKSLYEAGFNKGLIELCTYQNGYLIGNDGKALPRICPKDTQEKFVQGFIAGQSNHDSKVQMEKQNELIEKAIDSNKIQYQTCDFDSECGINQSCSFGQCR